MKKVYIVVDACSGEDYSTDDPTVLFVTENFEKAKQYFENEIESWEDGMENFDSNIDDSNFVYECIDFEGDSHRILKIVEKEVIK